MSGSMSGVWRRGQGRTSEAPPNERGGNRYVRPTATAPHLDSTYIDRGDGGENTFIYNQLHAQRDALEAAFGGDLTWEPLEGKRACRIKSEIAGNIFDREQWPAMINFMTDAMVRMENAFREPLAAINRKLRNRERIALAPAPVPAGATVEAAEGS